MRSVILISAAALTVASCAQPGTPEGNNTAAFTRELAGRVAGRPPIPRHVATSLPSSPREPE